MDDLRAIERSLDHGNHPGWRDVEPDEELDGTAPGYLLVATARQDRHTALDQLRVGHHDRFAVIGRHREATPANPDDLPYHTVDADPVADPARVVGLQRDSAPQVAQHFLHRERDDAGEYRGCRDEAGEIDADLVHPVDGGDDGGDHHKDVRHHPRHR